MALFAKKRDEIPGIDSQPSQSNLTPAQSINNMRDQGFSNNQIVQNMQRDGMNMGDINNAMNQASMVPGQQNGPYPGQLQPQPPQAAPAAPMQGAPGQAQPDMGMPPPMPSGQPMQGVDDTSLNNMQFEELAESIIEEKWNELMKNVNKIIEWKNQMDSRFVQVEQRFNDLQHNFDELHKALIAKVNEYDQNILNVGSQVKAMEKVFSKVLPTFTETVSELGRITNYVKSDDKPSQPKGRPKKSPPAVENSSFSDDEEIPHELLSNL